MGDGKKRKGDHSPDNSVRKKEKTPGDDISTELRETDVSNDEAMDMEKHTNMAPRNNSQRRLTNMLSELIALTTELKEENLKESTENDILKVLSHLTDLTKKKTDINNKRTKNNTTTTKKRQQVTDITESMIIPGEIDNKKYIKIQFNNELKRTIHAFQVCSELKEVVDIEPSTIFTLNQSSFIAQIEITAQNTMKKITSIKSIADKACCITPYEPFNCSKGVMYVSGMEFDDGTIEEFKNWLKSRHSAIVNIELAPFIKSKFPDTHAFMITYNTKTLPHSIYIPGLTGETKVYPFVNRPMSCRKCLRYGHTEKKCRLDGPPLCGYCSEAGHSRSNCDVDVPKCFHCAEEHPVGSRYCSRHARECELVRIQDERRVSFKRAIQIENGSEIINLNEDKLPDLFTIHMTEEHKKSLKPWVVEKFLNGYLGDSLEDLRSINSTTYSAKTKSTRQSDKLITLKNINTTPVEVRKGNYNLRPKGIVYINDYDLSSFDDYKNELMKILPVSDITRAPWIKSKNNRATPLLLIFNKQDIPSYISIPGEAALTKVYQYKNKPLLCNRCQRYGHSFRRCESPVICGRCDTRGHSADTCESELIKCHHCAEGHTTGNKNCNEYKTELKIVSIQQKQGCSRAQARLQLNKIQQTFNNSRMYFNTALKQPPPIIIPPSNPSTDPTPPIIQRNVQINNPQPSTSTYQGKKTKAFLQSPSSGRIYEEEIYLDTIPTKHQLPQRNSDEFLEDDHSATLKIYNSSKNIVQTDSNSDRENYEIQLKEAHTSRKKIKDKTSKKDDNRQKSHEHSRNHRSRSHKGRKPKNSNRNRQ